MEERKLETMREILVASLFAALGVIVPILFHLVGLGRVFLPMHLPILTSGFFVSPIVAGAAGFVTPLVSSFLTGMPPLPIAAAMSIELATLASVVSLCYRFFGRKVELQKGIGKIISVLSSIIVAIVARIFVNLILIATVIAPLLQLPAGAFGLASVLVGMPGIILQLTIVPTFVLAIERMQKVKGLWTNES